MSILRHNRIIGLQGGTENQYYHLTADEHAAATRLAGSTQTGLLSSTDFASFNGKLGSADYSIPSTASKLVMRDTSGNAFVGKLNLATVLGSLADAGTAGDIARFGSSLYGHNGTTWRKLGATFTGNSL